MAPPTGPRFNLSPQLAEPAECACGACRALAEAIDTRREAIHAGRDDDRRAIERAGAVADRVHGLDREQRW